VVLADPEISSVLLLKSSQLKSLGAPLKYNHRSLFHWIQGRKPVVEQEDDWILHEDDLIALSDIDHRESSLASSFLNVAISTMMVEISRPDIRTDTYVASLSSLPTWGWASRPGAHVLFPETDFRHRKRLSIFIVVAVLIIPVFILVRTPWNRAWISVTVLLSVLVVSTLLSLSTNVKAKDVLLGSAA
jgi:hypothetical protein